MKILNLGSLNFDKVYDLEHFVGAGETLLSTGYSEFLGGKGLNQSLALAKAGAAVSHAGAVGPDGGALLRCLAENGVDTHLIKRADTVSGHAIIQSCGGQNCIIVYGGANQCVDEAYIQQALADFSRGDLLLVQNETSNVPAAMRIAKDKGMLVAFNASPVTDAMLRYPLELVDYFLINEVEGKAISGCGCDDHGRILRQLAERFPDAAIVLTVGGDGALYQDNVRLLRQHAYTVPVVDTTAAGDTFTGFFLAALAQALPVQQALNRASAAAALAVSKKGAANSIPELAEVLKFMEDGLCFTDPMAKQFAQM